MPKKRGVELSISFLVTVIFAIVIFVLGLSLFAGLFNVAQEQFSKVGPRINQALLDKISQGESVAEYPAALTIKRGGSAIFGVGIYNNLASDASFGIAVDASTAQDAKGNPISNPQDYLSIKGETAQSSTFIKKSESGIRLYSISIAKNAPSGLYLLDVQAAAGMNAYGLPKKVAVTVP